MNKLYKNIALAIVLLSVSVFVSYNSDVSKGAESHIDYDDSTCWMTNLPDNTLLGSMAIPGTHDSCANYDFPGLAINTAAAQELTLAQQLEAGVRFFDIRVSLENGILKVHHGIVYQHMTFDDVWTTCKSFLSEHPGETLILAMRGEFLSEENQAEVVPLITDKVYGDSALYVSDSVGQAMLGNVRGKIIMLRRKSSMTEVSGKHIFSGPYAEEEKNYSKDSAANWEIFKGFLDSAATDSEREGFLTVWTNCYYDIAFGLPDIGRCSSYIHPKLSEYLKGKTSVDLPCTIVVDHVNADLAHAIYSMNK